MQAADIISELRALGSETTKRTLVKHGAREPLFGVKIGDMKPIQKRIGINYHLALQLYDSGISDAMYLAGLVTDDQQMTRDDLQRWVEAAYWSLLSESTVPWVAAESLHGWEIGLRWIEDETETIASAGWATLGSLVGIKRDDELDLPALEKLLQRVAARIHSEPRRVRHTMNGFVACVGGYVAPLTDQALQVANAIGPVSIEGGETRCQVLSVRESIAKRQARGVLGKKRKTAKC